MPNEWTGAARRAARTDFTDCARTLDCEVAALEAVWQVESAGRAFRADGTLERRFEPHHFDPGFWPQIGFDPKGLAPWRASLKIGTKAREAMFAKAYALDAAGALRATSWGGPQIMGFNHELAGYASPAEMVRAFAADEAEQLRAFVRLVQRQKLATHLRSRDWRAFAAGYNGNGQAEVYGRKIEAAYRSISGNASPQVVQRGDEGAAVRRVQEALGVTVDGGFGAETEAAVLAFQRAHGLKNDGIVGARTWQALQTAKAAEPPVQDVPEDPKVRQVIDWAVKGGGGVVLWDAARETAPPEIIAAGWYVLFAAVVVLGGVQLWRWVRA